MSRVIKFRAWSKLSKKMISQDEGDIWFSPNVDTTSHRNQSVSVNTVLTDESLIPMQFTGLKDINGVEIYEGDIAAGFNGELIGVISWSNEDCAFVISMTGGGGAMLNQQYMDNFKIIGSTHQNPGLLKWLN